MSEVILKTNSLTKTYGGVPAVQDLNMTINKGDIYGFVGQNGAGKTTLMRIVSGLIFPTSGSYELMGVRSTDKKRVAGAMGKVCSMIESPALYLNMDGLDNLKQQCLVTGKSSSSRIGELLEMVGLQYAGSKRVADYSLGMKQRLGIAVAMVSQPEFMLLDEPTNGLDPEGIHAMRDLFRMLNREKGVTILISSHILSELQMVANRYGFIQRGRLVSELSREEMDKVNRPAIELSVSDVGKTLVLLKLMDVECRPLGGKVVVEGNFDIGEIAIKLRENGVQLFRVENRAFDLESHFLSVAARTSQPYGYGMDPFNGGGV